MLSTLSLPPFLRSGSLCKYEESGLDDILLPPLFTCSLSPPFFAGRHDAILATLSAATRLSQLATVEVGRGERKLAWQGSTERRGRNDTLDISMVQQTRDVLFFDIPDTYLSPPIIWHWTTIAASNAFVIVIVLSLTTGRQVNARNMTLTRSRFTNIQSNRRGYLSFISPQAHHQRPALVMFLLLALGVDLGVKQGVVVRALMDPWPGACTAGPSWLRVKRKQ